MTDDGQPGSVISRGNYSLPLHNIVTFESVLTMKGLAPEITRGQGGRRCSVDDISQAGINARDRRGLVLTNPWPESISPDLPWRKSHSFWPLGKENFSFELWSWRKTQCLSLPQGLDVWPTLCQVPWRTIANRAGRSLSSQAYKCSVWHFSYSYNPFSIHRDVAFPFFSSVLSTLYGLQINNLLSHLLPLKLCQSLLTKRLTAFHRKSPSCCLYPME